MDHSNEEAKPLKQIACDSVSVVVRALCERVLADEMGDDIPIIMSDLGCDYEASCEAIFSGDKELALRIIGDAVMKVPDCDEDTWLSIQHDNDTWLILSKGVSKGGKTYCHLASTARFKQQANGSIPMQIGDWIAYDVILSAREEALQSVKKRRLSARAAC